MKWADKIQTSLDQRSVNVRQWVGMGIEKRLEVEMADGTVTDLAE